MPNKDLSKDKTPENVKTLDEVKKRMGGFYSPYDSKNVLEKARTKMDSLKGGESLTTADTDLFKALTLLEFDKGFLLTIIIPDTYRVFALNMLQELQKEYNCSLTVEKATAELVVISYVRILELQRRVSNYLEKDGLGQIDLTYFSLLSKELDRANRHYLGSLEALRGLKQPQLGINIRANTAVIGQNQVVQANNNLNGS